jgi:prophage antirepressor-like protein
MLVEIKGIRSEIVDEVIYLNLEDVAKGLGFEREQTINGKIYKSVRWGNVREYVGDFHQLLGESSIIGNSRAINKDSMISEPMFYMLAMKSNSDIAKEFQIKIATEILPSIRKKGYYLKENATQQQILEMSKEIKELQIQYKYEKEGCSIMRSESDRYKLEFEKMMYENSKLKKENDILKNSNDELKVKSDFIENIKLMKEINDLRTQVSILRKEYKLENYLIDNNTVKDIARLGEKK